MQDACQSYLRPSIFRIVFHDSRMNACGVSKVIPSHDFFLRKPNFSFQAIKQVLDKEQLSLQALSIEIHPISLSNKITQKSS